MLSARARAAQVLARVVTTGEHLDQALERCPGTETDPRDVSLTRELGYGVMRWYYRLDPVLGELLDKPLKPRHADIRMLMLCGLYQLEFLRIPDHAAIAGTVEAARELKKKWAVPLINAVLRRYQREGRDLCAGLAESGPFHYAHPDWLIETLRRQWPQHWQAVLEAGNQRPPMHLRVNLARTVRSDYLGQLHAAGLEAEASGLVESGIHVTTPTDVTVLPGFGSGLVSVQDFGAQLAAPLLDIRQGQRVLDACAAPGGKTGHIAEVSPAGVELVAVESDPERVRLLEQARNRLGFNAKVIHSDIIHMDYWWDGRSFDRILLDVPCSATGVIRRHPDIKFLRMPEQIAGLAARQDEILEAVWPVLAAGGKLLFVTCSILKEEGEDRIRKFIERHPDCRSEALSADWGVPCDVGRQLLPGMNKTDGFYYARLLKTG